MNPAIVSGEEQRKALRAVLTTLSAETLTLPEALLKLSPPRPPGFERTRESFPAQTGLTFDPIGAAESAADLTLSLLFDPQRAARLIEYGARTHTPALGEVIDAALQVNRPVTRAGSGESPRNLSAEVQAAVYARTVEALLSLAADSKASAQVRAITYAKLQGIKRSSNAASPLEAYLVHRIKDFESDPAKFVVAKPIEAPPGMPIGDDED
jgi:Met-zincin